jgi:hypothetical protein
MVSMFALHVVDHGFKPGHVKSKTVKLVFVASPLSMQLYGVREKTDGLGIRIMQPCGATFLPANFRA